MDRERKPRVTQESQMSYREIAHELGITETEAFVICRSALRKLRRNRQVAEMFELSNAKPILRRSA